jgi:iron complex transport system substrate-binding protein
VIRAIPVTAVLAILFAGAVCPRAVGAEKPRLRIVSLAPSVTEILFALDVGDCLVGVTQFCDFPPAAKTIPRVGGFGQPNVEKLLSLAPDLVIATAFERKDVADALRKSGIRVLELKIGNFAELFEAIRKVGEAVGQPERAARKVEAMQAQLDAVAKRFAGVPRARLPRVYVEIWSDPIMTVGGKSFVDEVVTRAGGVNVAHDLDREYPAVNPEKVIEWNPDVILIGYMMDPKDAVLRLAARIGWADVKAVREGRVIADIPADDFLRPGPRLVEGVRLLAERLHPPQPGKAVAPAESAVEGPAAEKQPEK